MIEHSIYVVGLIITITYVLVAKDWGKELAYWITQNIPEWIADPLALCPVCMCTLYCPIYFLIYIDSNILHYVQFHFCTTLAVIILVNYIKNGLDRDET